MGNVFKVFVAGVLLLLLTSVPQLRPILFSPLTMVQGTISSIEMKKLQKMVLAERERTGTLPEDSAFAKLVRSESHSPFSDSLFDSWKNPYEYTRSSRGFEIRSIGPDGESGTKDDLVVHWEE